MISKIKDIVESWYYGDDGDPEYDFVEEIYIYKRQPYRHWTAKIAHKIVDLTSFVFRPISKNPNQFFTQLFAFLAIAISATSLYLQFYKDDDQYKRCTITHTNNDTVTLECKK